MRRDSLIGESGLQNRGDLRCYHVARRQGAPRSNGGRGFIAVALKRLTRAHVTRITQSGPSGAQTDRTGRLRSYELSLALCND